MRHLITAAIVSALALSSPAFAGAGHDHNPDGGHSHGPITSDAAVKRAEKQVKTLVSRGKLDKSWEKAKSTGATQKDFGKGPEWIVTLKNDTVTDAAKQTLYVFYTLNGSYLASNFTGK